MEHPPIRVLHVEDNEFFATVASDVLETEADMTVCRESNATDALARLDDERFDCVVSDYEMPGMDGLELLDVLRDDYSEMPFVLLTGVGSEDTASEAISAGVTDYLQKGEGKRQFVVLANRITNAVSRRRAEKSASRVADVNDLVWDVSQSLLQASSKEEIERAVCERLADSELYRFTWVGKVDDDCNVIPRVSAGIEDSYLDDVDCGESAREAKPLRQALERREAQVTRNVESDLAVAQLRETGIERDCYSKAVVPFDYEDTTYGVLNVYADELHAFGDTERRILSKFGNSVAYAMNSIQTRQELVRHEQRLQVFNRILRHNLRNDLNVVLGHADNLAETIPSARESADVIRRKASELIDVSEKAREVGKTLDGECQTRKAVELTAVVERIQEKLQDTYPDANLSADVPKEAWVYGDNTLDAVVSELVENAVEHNDSDVPNVSIAVRQRTADGDDQVELTVADDGPGIPEEERTVLLEGRETALHHGSGLGLWLANWVVGKFGGNLEFGHNQPRGSVVTIRLERADGRATDRIETGSATD
ncbi:response regulator [Halomicrococcus sp. NG-SE-24]|uniref:response regulator n=1 Tax=Halomicrococcus sp. NG-SE-24 TaxID=3436928 RepID=UPI003D97D5FF